LITAEERSGENPKLIEETLANKNPPIVGTPTDVHRKDAEAFSRDAYLAIAFLLGADCNRYGALIEKLENDFIQGKDKYPKTVVQAYHLITNYKNNPKNLLRAFGASNNGVAFTTFMEQKNGKGSAKDNDGTPKERQRGGGRGAENITCYNCEVVGHYTSDCRRRMEPECRC
jgi:hypothetical protein